MESWSIRLSYCVVFFLCLSACLLSGVKLGTTAIVVEQPLLRNLEDVLGDNLRLDRISSKRKVKSFPYGCSMVWKLKKSIYSERLLSSVDGNGSLARCLTKILSWIIGDVHAKQQRTKWRFCLVSLEICALVVDKCGHHASHLLRLRSPWHT